MPKLGKKFEEAFIFANNIHAQQVRKGSNTPYISHLLAVTSLVLEQSGTETEAIAALLHDAIEDQGISPQDISNRFGTPVSDIIKECSDSISTSQKPPWKERKTTYLNSIPNKSNSALLVTMADKLHNARSILMDYREHGETVWTRFSGGKEGTIWYYKALAETFSLRTRTHPLAIELGIVISELEGLVNKD